MEEHSGCQPLTGTRIRILVVDDEPAVSGVVVDILKKNGFDAWDINDPLEVPQRSAELHPDLIILDYEMPNLQGPELSVLLKSRTETRAIPTVFLSGMTDPDSHETGAFTGAAAYLDKPLDEIKLIATIRALTENPTRQVGRAKGARKS
jgi:twitching motility two-component system response regulator PilH